MYDIIDKVFLITGAAKGIGAAIAADVLKEGAKHVRILDIDDDTGVQLQNQLNNKHGSNKVKYVKCDVTNDDQFFDAFNKTKEEQGYLDVVVNNAGVANESTYSAIRKQIEINYIAVVNGTLKAMELMDKGKGGRGGTVINISSIAGMLPLCPPLFSYSSTKCAVLQFTSCIGAEPFYSDTGVRVIALCFGSTDTTIFETMTTFQGRADQELKIVLDRRSSQSVKSAVRATIEAYKKGKSASVWLARANKPAVDITDNRKKCHEDMAKLLEH